MKLINPEVRIENCSICNAFCTICPRDKLTRPQMIMSFDHFKKLVDEAASLKARIISVFGYGEPLLDPNIATKVAYCFQRDLKTFITTNGSFLNKRMITGLIGARLSKIRISMHGSGENYEKVHRGLSFKRFTENLAAFMELNGAGNIQSELSIIPMNGESVESIRKQWEGTLDHLEIWKPHNWAYGKNFRVPVREKKTCGRPFTGPVQINADGKMMVCCFDFNAEMEVGDTHKNSIEEILNGDRFNKIREKHKSGKLTGLPCETCDQLNEYEESPLLFSTKDKTRGINKTSTNKFELKEI